VILASSHLGFALSTTQVCSGGILGAGIGRRLAEVRWGVAGHMALAWVFTLPAAAVVGGVSAAVAKQGTAGIVVICLAAVAVAVAIYTVARRNPVTAGNVNDQPTAPVVSATAA
jgi:PiT family inorganic phosphate transporter